MNESAPSQTAPAAERVQASRERRRVFALFLAVLALSVVQAPVLIGIPLIVLILGVPTRRLPGLVAGVLAALLAFGWAPRDALWYAERGWAILLGGWFTAVTLRWPATRFFPRALGSVAGALTVTLLVLGAFVWVGRSAAAGEGPAGPFETLDSLVANRARAGVSAALEAARTLQSGDTPAPEGTDEEGAPGAAPGTEREVGPDLVQAVQRAVEFQILAYPALLGLASLAALGVAWWIYLRFARGMAGALGPFREFRFNDQLVWLFIAGLALLLIGRGEVWRAELMARTGSNAVVFMGTLYALRGAAVVLFVSGGLSLMGAALVVMGLLFVAPVIGVSALIIGLGDTWLDLRGRVSGQGA